MWNRDALSQSDVTLLVHTAALYLLEDTFVFIKACSPASLCPLHSSPPVTSSCHTGGSYRKQKMDGLLTKLPAESPLRQMLCGLVEIQERLQLLPAYREPYYVLFWYWLRKPLSWGHAYTQHLCQECWVGTVSVILLGRIPKDILINHFIYVTNILRALQIVFWLNRYMLVYTTLRLIAWLSSLIKCLWTWFGSCMSIVRIGINAWIFCCLQCWGYCWSPQGFPPLNCCRMSRGVLDLIKENWEMGLSTSKNEVQNILDQKAKLQTMSWLSRENLLQAQESLLNCTNLIWG